MPRATLAILLIFLMAPFIATACGGGDGDDRVKIRHLDLDGVELSWADYFDPPLADQYPLVVADVTRVPITGQALAAEQVLRELTRRQAAQGSDDPIAGELLDPQLTETESTDPLDALIDDEVLRQAAERLGFLPSYEEAVEYTRESEEQYQEAIAGASADERQSMQDLLQLQGFPDQDWAADDNVVDVIRQGMGLARLRSAVCETSAPSTLGPVNLISSGWDCSEFLAEQRTDADIRYFVKWED